MAQLAPQLMGPSVRKLKVSYVRAGSGVPGPGAPLPLRAARPPAPASAAAGRAGAREPDRAGLEGAPGAAALCRDPPAET